MASEEQLNKTEELFTSSSLIVPYDLSVAFKARQAVASPSLRVNDLALIINLDPVLTLHILRQANSVKLAGDKRSTASIKTAIIRLGSRALITLLDEILEQDQPTLGSISDQINLLRKRALASAEISRILSNETKHRSSEDCFITGLLYNFGEFLALVKLESEYTKLSSSFGRAHLIFHLQEKFGVDLERIGAQWLKKSGIPEPIVAAVDPASYPQYGVSSLRPLVLAAVELIDAFYEHKINRFAPGRTPPARSAVRMLGLSSSRYERAFSQITSVLSSMVSSSENSKELQETLMTVTSNEISSERAPIKVASSISPQKEVIKSLNSNIESGGIYERIMRTTKWRDLCRIATEYLCQSHLFLRTAIVIRSHHTLTLTFSGLGGVLSDKSHTIQTSTELTDFLRNGITTGQASDRNSKESPFGSKTFAISNLGTSSYDHIFIYADCGEASHLPKGAEKIFSSVIKSIIDRLQSEPPISGVPEP
jgi:HD-like signal output (HDOD) protein